MLSDVYGIQPWDVENLTPREFEEYKIHLENRSAPPPGVQ